MNVDLQAVRESFPETWTHVHNLDMLRIGWRLKLAGVEWRSLEEMFARCEKAGVIQRDGYTIRRTPGCAAVSTSASREEK